MGQQQPITTLDSTIDPMSIEQANIPFHSKQIIGSQTTRHIIHLIVSETSLEQPSTLLNSTTEFNGWQTATVFYH